MKNQLVLIEWLDSKGVIGEWEFTDSLNPLIPCKCVSVGFLIDNNKNYKTIVQTKSDEQVVGRMTIPTCSIKKIRRIS